MTCPCCKEHIQEGALKCKHCRSMLTSPQPEMAQGPHEPMRPARAASQAPSFTHLFWSHDGRINRAKYWLGSLLVAVLYIIPYVIFESIEPGLGSLAGFITLYPSLMLAIKHAHDLDRAGHFCWLLLVPLVNLVPTIMLGFCKGTTGPNRFGPDPLAPAPVVYPEVPFSQAV